MQLSEHSGALVLLGGGGVGKTTTAAAIAVKAAVDGQRVLCLTIDPARRLAQSLGLQRMQAESVAVDAGLFDAHGLILRGELHAMMLDAKATFDDLVCRYATSTQSRDRILRNPIYQQLSTSLTGTQEYMAMEKLYELRESGAYDLIVLDTPPATHAVDFLTAPDRLVEILDSPAVNLLGHAFREDRRFSLNLVGKGASMLLSSLSRFTGAGFLEDVASFVSSLNELFGGFRDRAFAVAETLRADDVHAVIVSRLDKSALRDAVHLRDVALAKKLPLRGLLVNKVHPFAFSDWPDITTAGSPIGECLNFEHSLASTHAQVCASLSARLPDSTLLWTSYDTGDDVRELGELYAFADSLTLAPR